MKLLDLQTQYQTYQQEIDAAVHEVIASGHFIGGTVLTRFEEALSSYCGAPYAIGCSSGTDALLLALMALEVGPGDEVITTPYSFIATAEVIGLLKAQTVFVDVDSQTFNIDVSRVAGKISDRTKAVIPVSLFGELADLKTLGKIAQEKGITVIEDGAQSYGATSPDGKSGNLSKLATTSFFPAKPLGGYGDGGAVFTQDLSLANKIKILLNHGQSRQYYHDVIGINGRLDTIQAAVLTVKLKYLDRELESRNRIAKYYRKHINADYFIPQKTYLDHRSAYAQYCLTLNCSVTGEALSQLRDKVRIFLTDKGIPNAVYYPVPIHVQKPFLELGYRLGDFPASERLSQSMFAIPIHPFLTQNEIEKVVVMVNMAGDEILKNSK